MRAEHAADRCCLRRLWLFLFVVYALTMAGRLTSGDGEAMYLTTSALATQARLSIEPRPETAIGRGGRAYSKYGIGQSFVQAPLFVLGHTLGKLFGAVDDRPARFTVGLTNSVVTATLTGVFWLLLRELGCARTAATAAALVLGLATPLWPYARADFAEPLQAGTLLFALYALVRWRRQPTLRWAALAGGAAGFAVLTKAASLILLPPFALYLAIAFWQQDGRGGLALGGRPRPLTTAAAALAPLACCAAVQAALNVYRFGSVSEFGYGSEPGTGFTTPLVVGVRNLLVSPGKGLALFAPPAILGLALLPGLGRRQRPEAMVAALVFLAELLYYARWWAWHGDWCWGPRYLVVTLPFVMLGWGPLFVAWRRRPVILRAVAGLVVGAGLLVSLLGVAVDYGAYYSVVAYQIGRGVDVKEARLVPEFSPLLGHAWLAAASLYDALAGTPAAVSERASPRRADNPFGDAYPWRWTHPELRPKAPERVIGFDFWFAALKERPPFLEYWSGLVACWLGLALVPLGGRLWAAARAPATAGLPAPAKQAAARHPLEVAPA